MTLHAIVVATADEDLRETAHIVLEKPLIYVFDADDGAAALRLLREAEPDVLIVDGGLPGLDLEDFLPALEEVRLGEEEEAGEEGASGETQLVVLLPRGEDDTTARRYAAAVLPRDFDPDELERTIEALLASSDEVA